MLREIINLPIHRSHISIDDYQFAQIPNRTSTWRPDQDYWRLSLPRETCVCVEWIKRKMKFFEKQSELSHHCSWKFLHCILIMMFKWKTSFMHSLSINRFCTTSVLGIAFHSNAISKRKNVHEFIVSEMVLFQLLLQNQYVFRMSAIFWYMLKRCCCCCCCFSHLKMDCCFLLQLPDAVLMESISNKHTSPDLISFEIVWKQN